jgi:signal transduction histidine kinase
MAYHIREAHIQNSAELLAGAVKRRIRFIFLVGMVSVALVFGLSFYFAIVSNSTAVARQIPELDAVVSRMKSLLIINTFIFALIIAASFYVLSILLTSRMFRPLGNVREGLGAVSRGTIPVGIETASDSPFSEIEATLKAAIDRLREKESSEIEKLSKCIGHAADGSWREDIAVMIKEKNAFLGIGGEEESEAATDGKDPESLFMQPVE